MGLDITAYKNLKKVDNPVLDDEGYPVNWESEWLPGSSMDWSEEHFPGRAEGIDSKAVYTYEDSFDFRAGSYGRYGLWRDRLCDLSDGKSFVELTWFADNEGVIGYVVAEKLYKDFVDNYEKAKAYSQTFEDGEYWFKKYETWMQAFEYAKDHGAVDFH